MTETTTDRHTRLTPELMGQIARLSPEDMDHVFILLQEKFDGGPFVGDLPERPADEPANGSGWSAELARRLDDIRTGRVKTFDARLSAATIVAKMVARYKPR